MNPIDPALIAGSTPAGGKTPPAARVKTLTDEAQRELDAATRVVLDAELWLTQQAGSEATAAHDAITNSVGELARETVRVGNLAARAARKAVERLDVLASDELMAARRAVENVGGTLPVLYEDAMSYVQAQEYEYPALEMILGPAVQQQLSREAAGIDPTDTDREVPGMPGEPFTPVDPPKPDPGWGPIVVTDPIPIPWPVDDPPAPPPGGGGEPPPPPVSPPPPGDVCCPVLPAPIVNVVVNVPGVPPVVSSGGSPPTPPVPPSPPVPPGEPPEDWQFPPFGPIPPAPPPPPPPAPPPVFKPTPQPVGFADVVAGSYDGDKYCTLVADCARVNGDQTKGVGWLEFLSDAVGAMVSTIPFMREQGRPAADTIKEWGGFFLRNSGFIAAQTGIADPVCVANSLIAQALPSFVDRWTGIDYSYTMEPIKQTMRHSSPVMIPGQSAIDAAWLANTITEDEWNCYTRSNGNLPQIHAKAMMAQAGKWGVNEAAALRRRGLIDVKTYQETLRKHGIFDAATMNGIYALGEYIPPVSDLMHWMVKDVANEQYVAFAQLDEGFAESWNAQFQKWAKDNGISDEQIKYEYRAQWQDLSPTTIYSMVHRLRPGRVDQSVAFTQQNALDLLKIQEVPAGFRQRMLEIAYVPINRTDIIAMRKAGTMTEAESKERMMDLGYSPADAQVQAEFITMKVRREEQASMGAWTQRRIIKEYIGGSITRDDGHKLLSRTVLDRDQRIDALDDADLIRSAQTRAKCIKGIRRRYFTGELTAGEALQWLQAQNVDRLIADEMIAGWECEARSRSKEPTVAFLTSWAEKGIITAQEMNRRLRNLGYTADDADRIVKAADIDYRKQLAKEAQAAADRAERKARQAAKDKEAAAKKAQGGKK